MGVPIRELLEQDHELRKKLQLEREEKKQRREFLKAAGDPTYRDPLNYLLSSPRKRRDDISVGAGVTLLRDTSSYGGPHYAGSAVAP